MCQRELEANFYDARSSVQSVEFGYECVRQK